MELEPSLLYGANIFTDDYVVLSQCTRLTDRQTDRQTDRNTIAGPALHTAAVR